MHRLDFDLIGQGAGYRPTCSCGQWSHPDVIRDPRDDGQTQEVRAAHMRHEFEGN